MPRLTHERDDRVYCCPRCGSYKLWERTHGDPDDARSNLRNPAHQYACHEPDCDWTGTEPGERPSNTAPEGGEPTNSPHAIRALEVGRLKDEEGLSEAEAIERVVD